VQFLFKNSTFRNFGKQNAKSAAQDPIKSRRLIAQGRVISDRNAAVDSAQTEDGSK
jgi:hypothetical protein